MKAQNATREQDARKILDITQSLQIELSEEEYHLLQAYIAEAVTFGDLHSCQYGALAHIICLFKKLSTLPAATLALIYRGERIPPAKRFAICPLRKLRF